MQSTFVSFFKKNKLETILFAALWTLVILRSFLVFYIHDEIVTKYAYMIDWNPFPFKGYIDANNHFLNSLLGGFFIRLFHSEAIWICRLPNVLAFPLFFWSIVGFRKYFTEKWAFLLLLVSLSCSVFILDFFSLARGYGLAWAFLLLALVSTANYLEGKSLKSLAWAVLAWLLCVYANLSVVVVSLMGLVLLLLISIQRREKNQIVLVAFSLILLSGAIYYALFLQEIGKLYLGNKSDFISTTLHDLSTLLFSINHWALDGIIILVFLVAFIVCLKILYNNRFEIKANQLFTVFLSGSIIAIFAQNFLLSVNFPEDRSAGFLVLFFYGSFSFLIDRTKFKRIAQSILLILIFCFVTQVNFTHTRTFDYEHMDRELIGLIPPFTDGIPTSTGGRFWSMDNELIKTEKFPPYTFQPSGFEDDTLIDYIIHRPSLRPNIEKVYSKIHEDKISGLALFKRNQFLKRIELTDSSMEIRADQEYISLQKGKLISPCFARITGSLKNLDFYDQVNLVVVAQDSITGIDYFGETFSILERVNADESKNLAFDFTYTIKTYSEANELEVFVHNKNKLLLEGNLRVRVYQIE